MALTLLEAAKLNPGQEIRNAIVEMFVKESQLLQVIPFQDIQGNSLKYVREEALPAVGFRGINEAYEEGVGVLNPLTEALVIIGGDIDTDNFITKTMGQNQRAVQEAMKMKALAHEWTRVFIKGNSATDPRQFDGLELRIPQSSSQYIRASDSAVSAALSLEKLDEAIDAVDSATHLLMSKAMRRKLTVAARSTGVADTINYTPGEFGRQITVYNGLPIIEVDQNGSSVQQSLLQFDEPNFDNSASDTTSIYVVTMGDGMLTGIQNGGMDVRDLGEIDEKPVERTRIEWYSGMALFHGRAVARLANILNLPVVP